MLHMSVHWFGTSRIISYVFSTVMLNISVNNSDCEVEKSLDCVCNHLIAASGLKASLVFHSYFS